jgi:hypothetical protein
VVARTFSPRGGVRNQPAQPKIQPANRRIQGANRGRQPAPPKTNPQIGSAQSQIVSDNPRQPQKNRKSLHPTRAAQNRPANRFRQGAQGNIGCAARHPAGERAPTLELAGSALPVPRPPTSAARSMVMLKAKSRTATDLRSNKKALAQCSGLFYCSSLPLNLFSKSKSSPASSGVRLAKHDVQE